MQRKKSVQTSPHDRFRRRRRPEADHVPKKQTRKRSQNLYLVEREIRYIRTPMVHVLRNAISIPISISNLTTRNSQHKAAARRKGKEGKEGREGREGGGRYLASTYQAAT